MKKMICLLVICGLMLTACAAGEESSAPVSAEPTAVQTPAPTPTAAPAETPVPEPTPTPEPAVQSGIGYIRGKDVNIREKPDSESKVLAKSKKNELVTVTKYDYGHGWSEIEYSGSTAYVASQYLAIAGASNEKIAATISADDVNLRYTPSTKGDPAGKLSKGAKVTVAVKEAGNEWSAIEQEGQLYFVATKFITF